MRRLPNVLEREPLVEVVFEVRLIDVPLLSEIVPGALFGAFSPRPAVTRLPAAALPFPMRKANPNLEFAPVVQLDLGGYLLSIGDRNFVIGCKLPYPKWAAFRDAILDVIEKVAAVGIVGDVERYSLKYTNLIDADSEADQISKIDMGVRLGDLEVLADHFSLQVRRQERDILHIVSVTTGGEAQMPDGKIVRGVVVDVDSIRLIRRLDITAFAAGLRPGLEDLRV